MKYCLFTICMLMSVYAFGQQDKAQQLTNKQFENYGLPNINKPWDLNDVDLVLSALSKLKADNPLALPKFNNSESSPYLKKLISSLNLKRFITSNASEKEISEAFTNTKDPSNNLFKLYVLPQNNVSYYHAEVAALTAFFLSNVRYGTSFSVNFVKSHPNLTEVQKANVNNLHYGYWELLELTAIEMSEVTIFDVSDLDLLSREIKNSLKTYSIILEDYQQRFIKQILIKDKNVSLSAFENKNIEEAISYLNK